MTLAVILWLASLVMIWSITVADLAVTRVDSVMMDTAPLLVIAFKYFLAKDLFRELILISPRI